MTKKEVRKFAFRYINEGKSKQQTFEKLKEMSDRPLEQDILKSIS